MSGALRALGFSALLGSVPILWVALRYLAERDYVAGALAVVASAAVGHLGLELVALSMREPPREELE